MGKHERQPNDLGSLTLADSTIPGLSWHVALTPDDDTADGLTMYDNHGYDWRWVNVVVTPVINDMPYRQAAHGQTMAFGTLRSRRGWMNADIESFVSGGRFYTYDDNGVALSDRYESILPVVPQLISMASESLPTMILDHSREAVAIADALAGDPDACRACGEERAIHDADYRGHDKITHRFEPATIVNVLGAIADNEAAIDAQYGTDLAPGLRDKIQRAFAAPRPDDRDVVQHDVVITASATLNYPTKIQTIAGLVTKALDYSGLFDEVTEVSVEDGYDGPATQAGGDGVYADNH